MKNINDYINLPLVERQAHLDLSEECHERGAISYELRGLLAYYLDTNVPRGSIAYCCHACNNENCANPKHLYWGTVKENVADFKTLNAKWIDRNSKISNSNKGEKNINFGLKPWNNSKAIKENWSLAKDIFEEYMLNEKAGRFKKGPSYFSKIHNISLGTTRSMIRMFNDGWNPSLDPEWTQVYLF